MHIRAICKLFSLLVIAFLSQDISLFAQGWTAIPNSIMHTVCPANEPGGGYQFYSMCPNVVNAWNGGVFDTKRNRLIIWGGGHGDYSGNEIYSLDLNANPKRFQRLTSPSIPVPSMTAPCSDAMPDGDPTSRHTYGMLAYLAHADRLWAYSGSIACGSGGFSTGTWTFDFSTLQWQNMNPTGIKPPVTNGIPQCAYDSVTHNVFCRDDIAFYSYDFGANVWTRLKDNDLQLGTDYDNAVIDPVRRKFVIIGRSGVHTIDLRPGSSYTASPLTTTGPQTILSTGRSPGLAYNSANGLIAAWDGSDSGPTPDTVYTLDLNTAVWTAHQSSGGPSANPDSRGTWGRFQYSPALDSFVVVSSINSNAYLFKLTASGGSTPPRAPTNLSIKQDWIALANRSWTTRPAVGYCPFANGTKHMNWAQNTTDGKFYSCGGDWPPFRSDIVGPGASGNNEMVTYDAGTDTWALIQRYLRPDLTVQPWGPDQVGWVYDSLRNIFWMIYGQGGQGWTDPNPRVLYPKNTWSNGNTMTFDPLTQAWTVRADVPSYGQLYDGVHPLPQMVAMVYDPVTDSIYSVWQDKMFIINLKTSPPSWSAIASDANNWHGAAHLAIDTAGRRIYWVEYHYNKLHCFHIDTRTYDAPVDTPADISLISNDEESRINWDSVNNILLYTPNYQNSIIFFGAMSGTFSNNAALTLYRGGVAQAVAGTYSKTIATGEIIVADISGSLSFVNGDQWRDGTGNYFAMPDVDSAEDANYIRLFAYKPGTGWETLSTPMVDGYRPAGRNAFFDPYHNCLIVGGPKMYNAPTFLYRYGDGSGKRPAPTP